MKRIIVVALTVIIFTPVHAQKEAQQTVLSANAGFRAYRLFITSQIIGKETDSALTIRSKANPLVICCLDHFISKKISIPGWVAFQSVSINHSRLFEDSLSLIENVDTTAAKLRLTLRGLFYYVARKNKLIYSGFKLGYQRLKTSHNSFDMSYHTLNDFVWNRVTIGLISFGIPYFLNENFGCNFEGSFGVPNLLSFGLNDKIPDKKSS
jgi:hypothetical protein